LYETACDKRNKGQIRKIHFFHVDNVLVIIDFDFKNLIAPNTLLYASSCAES